MYTYTYTRTHVLSLIVLSDIWFKVYWMQPHSEAFDPHHCYPGHGGGAYLSPLRIKPITNKIAWIRMSQQTDFINSQSVKRDKMIGFCWDKSTVSYKPHHIVPHTQCIKQEKGAFSGSLSHTEREGSIGGQNHNHLTFSSTYPYMSKHMLKLPRSNANRFASQTPLLGSTFPPKVV